MRFGDSSVDAGRASRLPALGRPGDLAVVEVVTLLLLGAGAALATTFLKSPLRIPGSAILFSIFPTALAVALVPRRGAGKLASMAALATTLGLGFAGTRIPGAGATASLVLAGPLLDVALAAARSGWRLYLGFVLSGLVANLGAFGARAGVLALVAGGGYGHGAHRGGGGGMGAGLGGGGGMGGQGLRHALLTYAVCGLAAGLLSAAAWFRLRPRPLARSADAPRP